MTLNSLGSVENDTQDLGFKAPWPNLDLGAIKTHRGSREDVGPRSYKNALKVGEVRGGQESPGGEYPGMPSMSPRPCTVLDTPRPVHGGHDIHGVEQVCRTG